MLSGTYLWPREGARDVERAESVLIERCDDDHQSACHRLATMYYQGYGDIKNLPRAAEIYEDLCEDRYAASCDMLGDMLMEEEGVGYNPARAVNLYRRACGLGNANGGNRLGTRYEFDGCEVVDHGLAHPRPDQVRHHCGDPNESHHETAILVHLVILDWVLLIRVESSRGKSVTTSPGNPLRRGPDAHALAG